MNGFMQIIRAMIQNNIINVPYTLIYTEGSKKHILTLILGKVSYRIVRIIYFHLKIISTGHFTSIYNFRPQDNSTTILLYDYRRGFLRQHVPLGNSIAKCEVLLIVTKYINGGVRKKRKKNLGQIFNEYGELNLSKMAYLMQARLIEP